MSATDVSTTVSGGKVWTPPSDIAPPIQKKILFDGMMFGLACSFIVSAGLVLMMDVFIEALDIRIVNFSHFLPEKQTIISSDTGYPLSVPPSSFDLLPYALTAVMITITIFIMLCIFDIWGKITIALGFVAFITLLLGTSLSVQIHEIKTEKPMEPISWMNERYGFIPIANVVSNSMYDGMLMKDANNEEVIAEVKETHGEYFLYDLSGHELPVKK